MKIHRDERRDAYCDLFPGVSAGDVNVFVFHAGARTFWHRHQRQTDHFVVVVGQLMVYMVGHDQTVGRILLGPGDTVTIPPNHWHGYHCEVEGTVMVMHLDQRYDPTDEERCPEETFLR